MGLTKDGGAVGTVPPGVYRITVTDHSTIHNFHLTGPGTDKATTVPEQTTVTWELTLGAGRYKWKCDPHPGMPGEGTFNVG